MEPNFKLLATKSCDDEGECTVNMIDKFTSLPQETVHHILSHCTMKDLVRFSCVSKPCRKFSLSAPEVSLCYFTPNGIVDMSTCERRLKLTNELDRFLLGRGDSKMQRFDLIWYGHMEDDLDESGCFCINENFRIITWIQNAVRCKVERLYLEVIFYDYDGEPLAFPSCVFHCESLTYLMVEMPRTVIKTPSFAVSSNLEILDLREAVIQDEKFFKWVSHCCKLLKKLSLSGIRELKSVTIESSSLKDIYFSDYEMDETCYLNITCEKLENIHVDCRQSPSSTILNIVAPNVKYLILEGNVKNHLDLGELVCLKEASISIYPIVDNFDQVFAVLCSLSSVEVLILNEATIKATYRKDQVRAQLDELYLLRLNIGTFTDELVPAVAALLRRTPNLCTLYMCDKPVSLDLESNTSEFDEEYWKMQNLAFISHVKEVIIELSGDSNGIAFAMFILENADDLEKMVIKYLPEQSEVIGKLQKSKAISNATVTFEEYKRYVGLFL